MTPILLILLSVVPALSAADDNSCTTQLDDLRAKLDDMRAKYVSISDDYMRCISSVCRGKNALAAIPTGTKGEIENTEEVLAAIDEYTKTNAANARIQLFGSAVLVILIIVLVIIPVTAQYKLRRQLRQKHLLPYTTNDVVISQ